jgi:hypothetical protein
LLALGADDIVMHPFSNLGPADPQIRIDLPERSGGTRHISISTEDIRHYFDFIRSDVGITDQAPLSSALNSLADAVNPLFIGVSKKSRQLSLSLGARLLETQLEGNKDKIDSITQALNTSYHHHGYAVSRKEAEKIGLKIVKPEPAIASIMWDIWMDYCAEMKCNLAFDVYDELMNNPQSKELISNPPVARMPTNASSEAPSRNSADSRSQNAADVPEAPIEVVTLAGTIESSRLAHAFAFKHYITYFRNADMYMDANVIKIPNGWARLETYRSHP